MMRSNLADENDVPSQNQTDITIKTTTIFWVLALVLVLRLILVLLMILVMMLIPDISTDTETNQD